MLNPFSLYKFLQRCGYNLELKTHAQKRNRQPKKKMFKPRHSQPNNQLQAGTNRC